MVVRLRVFVCAIFALFTVWSAGAVAQSPFLPRASPAPAAAAKPAVPARHVDRAVLVKKANDATGMDIDAKIKGWRTELDRIDQAIHTPKTDLGEYRAALVKLREDAEAFWAKLEPPLKSAAEDVEALPPVRAEGQPPEPEQVAISRVEAKDYLDYLNSTRGALDGTQSRINKLLGLLQEVSRARVADRLSTRIRGIFFAATWREVPEAARDSADKVQELMSDWWGAQDSDQILPLAGIALAAWLLLTVGSFFAVRWLRQCNGEPPFWMRASTAAPVILLRSAPVVLPVIFLYHALNDVQVYSKDIARIFYAVARAVITVAVIKALVSAVLSPYDHRWRLIRASNGAAIRVSGLILLLVLPYAAAMLLVSAAFVANAPDSLKMAIMLFAVGITSLLTIAILLTPLRPEDTYDKSSSFWPLLIKVLIWLIVIFMVVAALTGYVSLSRFIAQQLVVTGAILVIVYLSLLWADGVARAMGDETALIGGWLSKAAKLDEGSRQRLAVPVSLLLKFAVLIAAIPLILIQWQYQWGEIAEFYRQLFFGLKIGSTTVSLAALLASLVVFILGYFAAKFFQQWLDSQILAQAGLSGGLRDSIRTGVGYIGVFAAALFALSYAGVSLASFAIVAGAFSVGIGFGLQSVVNNFVSGLILLAERPIKVGDLVVVGGEEGYVRKISVRSTEIETLDRGNVLIPNSFFVSEKVKNWTLRNNTVRLAIGVSVMQSCDPRAVKEILLQAAHSHPSVMRTPEPFVDFEEFSAGTLNFKLYAFIYDLNKSIPTRTDLRIAILDAFNAAGIAMPSHETDVTMRDDWLRDAVKLYMAKAMDGRPAQAGSQAHAGAASPAE